MIYITQLIYLKEGQEDAFEEFENIAIPLVAKYGGKLLFRVRPTADSFVTSDIEQPYEIHLVQFETNDQFERFMADEQRKTFLHLKERSMRGAWLMKGERI